MKKKIIQKLVFMVLLTCCLVFITGCSEEQEIPVQAQSDQYQGDIQYNPLIIETDNLFTKKDLESLPDLSSAVAIKAENNGNYTINTEGTYVLSGEAENFSVQVEADKDTKVQIVLNDVQIVNENFPVIYVKSADKCFITTLGENSLAVSGEYVSDGEINTDAVIFSRDDLTLNGAGALTIESKYGNGITAKDDLKITGGKYNISCALDGLEANDLIAVHNGEFTVETQKDAFHCENDKKQGAVYIKDGRFNLFAEGDGVQATTYLVIDGGDFQITSAEGLEATYVQINGGNLDINASDDGINAAEKSSDYEVVIEINGGDIKIVMDEGDTDGLDANGLIVVNGGVIDITGQSTFDYDRGAIYNGGIIMINGETVDEIPEPMMMGDHGAPPDFEHPEGKEMPPDFEFPNGQERPEGFDGPKHRDGFEHPEDFDKSEKFSDQDNEQK